MSSWIVPGLTDRQKLRAPKMVREDPTLHLSATGRMRHALHYFLGFKTANPELNWEDSQPDAWMNVIFGQNNGTSHTSWLWHKIIVLIFNKMHMVFIPNKLHINMALNAKLPAEDADPDQKKENIQTFLIRLSDWARESLKRSKQKSADFKITDLHPRQMQMPPDFIKT